MINKNDYVYKLETLLKEHKKNIERHPDDIKKLNDIFINDIFNLSLDLDKKQYNNYIKMLKKEKIYKYKNNKLLKKFIMLFPKTYIFLRMIKCGKNSFFYTRYRGIISKKRIYKIRMFLREPKENIFKRLSRIFPNKLCIDYLELVITTKCTLRCKNCANLMYMYDKPYDVEEDVILKSIEKLDECIDKLLVLRILGGEPFCNLNLKKYLQKIPMNKIKKVVIVTNGTLVPKDKELISIIKEKNIFVEISNYGKLSYKKEELIDLLQKEKIEYFLEPEQKKWYDYGTLKNYKKEELELTKQFLCCDIYCKSILNGCIYYCPRAAHGYDLGIVKRNENEYIDLINNDKKQNRRAIRSLIYRDNYIEACKYCKYATDKCKEIKAAEQK